MCEKCAGHWETLRVRKVCQSLLQRCNFAAELTAAVCLQASLHIAEQRLCRAAVTRCAGIGTFLSPGDRAGKTIPMGSPLLCCAPKTHLSHLLDEPLGWVSTGAPRERAMWI